MKGQKVKDGMKLVSYNAKLEPDKKLELEALAKVTGNSQRELLEEFVRLYRAAHPEAAEKAEGYIQLVKGV
ncbi:hypothetical protein HWB91_gp13 [Bacillus phage vB_BboS-125]|uniref:Uncharacterized protein n=1 Tax=Bacillus phage vB_BboS-125 TaxID=2419618 RepID=A0A3G3BVV6_9CAUD|nr:hypothetical protein HWB91_gp13 [Bacillus phage vB_BboS-125]AYP68383.1 hypothetical protein BboS125_00013 [Bacillus phage vB_BboS-125]